MLDRVANPLPVDASGLWVGLSIPSVTVLRRHERAGYSSGFTIMDREDQKDPIDTVVAAAGINPKIVSRKATLAEIFSFVINTETPIDALLAEKFPYFLPLLEQIKDVHSLREKKKSTNSMDFDDLLEKTLRMLIRRASPISTDASSSSTSSMNTRTRTRSRRTIDAAAHIVTSWW